MAAQTPPAAVPPNQAIKIVADGGISKLIIQEGTGAIPPLHSRCIVHYTGRLVATGEVFMNTREESTSSEPTTVIAGRDSSTTERGLYIAVGTMRVGEKSHIWTTAEYGYGARGNFSFPTIPPNAELVYEVELLDFEPPREEKSHSNMTYEERLEAAERRRCEGNEAFKRGSYQEALGRYSVALSFVDEDLMIQLQGFHYDKAAAARIPALLNSAACHLKLENYPAAVNAASQVLAENPGNAKALFRRGAARRALGQTEAALADLLAAKKAAPVGDSGILKELAAVKTALLEERQASDSVFKGLMEKTSLDGGLYNDDEVEIEKNDAEYTFFERAAAAAAAEEENEGNRSVERGWFRSVLEMVCPFAFGRRRKNHAE